jgi:branched-chain amino acid transport system substrate-binding protein
MIYVEAIKKAGPDRTKMMEWVTNLKDYEGISGTTSFNEDGDVIKVPLYLEVKGGEFTIIE